MAYIKKKDTDGNKPLLQEGELGYDKYPAGADVGRVYVGTGTENIPFAKKGEVDAAADRLDTVEAKLGTIESGATADQTAGEIKTAYESNADTNAFTDAEKVKLAGIGNTTTEVSGLVEKATSAEAIAGTPNKFPDAAGVKAHVDSRVTSSTTDTTVGRLVKVNDYGSPRSIVTGTDDLDTKTIGGNYYYNSNSPNAPTLVGGFLRVESLDGTNLVQYATENNTGGSTFRRIRSGGLWKPWVEIYHTDNTGTAVTSDVTESPTDTATGRLLKVGDFGAGVPIAFNTGGALKDLGEFSATLYASDASDPPALENGTLYHARHPSSQVTQMYCTVTGRIFYRAGILPTLTGWQEIYHTGNIVGTVSQSGGVPTGAVIERGSNVNGEYTKFADGTLICTCSPVLTSATANVAITFPAVFSISPKYAYGSVTASLFGAYYFIQPAAMSATGASIRTIRIDTNESVAVNSGITCIGRWY